MFFNDNTITLTNGISANEFGVPYTVSFLGSPAVYQAPSQATIAADQLTVFVLRADGGVLSSSTVNVGAWTGDMRFSSFSFKYNGDGSGSVKLKIACTRQEGRFCGAVENLAVTRS
eukprot:c15927_g1_i1.p2 GENE.c15927_g1_i1~~c15927_g1_i1.p2  ORF type:complete len:116 (-),score=31.85 c15927_g1_i1:10-357(-)